MRRRWDVGSDSENADFQVTTGNLAGRQLPLGICSVPSSHPLRALHTSLYGLRSCGVDF